MGADSPQPTCNWARGVGAVASGELLCGVAQLAPLQISRSECEDTAMRGIAKRRAGIAAVIAMHCQHRLARLRLLASKVRALPLKCGVCTVGRALSSGVWLCLCCACSCVSSSVPPWVHGALHRQVPPCLATWASLVTVVGILVAMRWHRHMAWQSLVLPTFVLHARGWACNVSVVSRTLAISHILTLVRVCHRGRC